MKQPFAYIQAMKVTLQPLLDGLQTDAVDPKSLMDAATTPAQMEVIRSSMLAAAMEAAGWTAYRPRDGERWHHLGRFTRVVFLKRPVQHENVLDLIYAFLASRPKG